MNENVRFWSTVIHSHTYAFGKIRGSEFHTLLGLNRFIQHISNPSGHGEDDCAGGSTWHVRIDATIWKLCWEYGVNVICLTFRQGSVPQLYVFTQYNPHAFHPIALTRDLVSWLCGCWNGCDGNGIVLCISHVLTSRGSVLIKANLIGSDRRKELNIVGLPKHQLNRNSIADSSFPRRRLYCWIT